MRIRAFRGAGLASLAAPFVLELDAEPLRSAGVFVIGGPTGAGKSTILDAMCLALFDRAPRIDRAPRSAPDPTEDEAIRASDPRSLVRRDATLAFAEVDFDGLRGGSYRARWEARSVRRRDGGRGVGKPVMTLVDLSAGAEGAVPGLRIGTTKTEVLAAIESRLGLDFAQFCRSVLLPQGELASFLEAPDDERARLLERITGTEIYSKLSRSVHERAAALVRAVRERSIELEAVPVLADDERTGLAAEAEEAGRRGARAGKRLAELTAAIRLHETSRVLREELAQTEREAAELGRQLVLWEPRRQDVALAGRARTLRPEREALASSERELEVARVDEARLASELSALVPEVGRREALRDRARAALATFDAGATGFEASVTAHEAALAGLAADTVRDGDLRASRRRAELAERAAQARLRDARKSAEAFERALADLEAELGELGGAAWGAASWGPLAELLQTELRPGEPCPVCGSLEHPGVHAASERERPTAVERGASPRRSDAAAAARALQTRRSLLERRDAARVEIARARATLAARSEDHERSQAELRVAEEAAESGAERLASGRARIEAEHGAEPPPLRRASRSRESDSLRAELSRCEGGLRTVELAREAMHARLGLVRERVAALESVRAERGARLEADLVERGLTSADLARVARLSDREIDGWASELERLDQQRDRQLAILAERRRRVELQAAEVPADMPAKEALELALREAEEERAAAEQRRARAEAMLVEDDCRRADRRARGDALAALRSQAATWETLARLVGSADGKKLRVLVQSMALDALLSHANHHLHVLAPRYQLARRTGGSLALDVVDGDLDGAPRATSSLSGGERFLVSLALALGLGTMTAERDDIGSLFLDEGFGALDEESLEQALEVLDALRQAGRQIGVVSHVGRLAERFEVRVEVLPTQAGQSLVRVRTA
jgi:exonuclease SbcC